MLWWPVSALAAEHCKHSRTQTFSGRGRAESDTIRPLSALMIAAGPDAVLPLTALLRPLNVGVQTVLRSGVHLWATCPAPRSAPQFPRAARIGAEERKGSGLTCTS